MEKYLLVERGSPELFQGSKTALYLPFEAEKVTYLNRS